MRNISAIFIYVLVLAGCTFQGSVLDLNALTPPVLTNDQGERLDSFIINTTSDLDKVSVRGECYQDDRDVAVKFVPENSTSAQAETKTFKAKCVDQRFSLELDTQTWSDTTYKIVLSVTSEAGISSATEASVLKDIVPPVLTFTGSIPAEIGSDAVSSIALAGTCESGDGDVEILAGSVVLSTWPCQSNGTFSGSVSGAGLIDGANTFIARQKDAAQNIGTTTSASFNKDVIAPLLLSSLGSLGSALSNDDSARSVTITLPTDGATQYRYVVVKDTDCSAQYAALMATTPVIGTTNIPLTFSGDGTYRICVLAGDQAGNWASAAGIYESSAVVIDKTNPALTITSPIASAKVHSTFNLTGTCEAGLTVTASGDFTPTPSSQTCTVGGTYSLALTLSNGDGAKNISVTSSDNASNATTIASHSIFKDTAIVPPSVTMTTSATMSTPLAKFTVGGCTDHTMILMKEVNSAPALGDSGWVPCSTVAENYVYDLSVTDTQGLRNIRFYARDEAGNVSTATVHTITYDSQAPIITIDAVPTLAKDGSYPFVVKVTETTVASTATLTLQYSTDGTTWNFAASRTLGVSGPMNNKSFSISWTPTSLYTGLRVRAMLTDALGMTGYGQSNAFNVVADTTAPTITANEFKINGSLNPDDTVRSYVTVSLQANDAHTAVTEFCLKTTNVAPLGSDACWVSVKAPKPGLDELATLNLVDFDFYLGTDFGVYNVYAWVKDVAGNISVNSATLKKDFNTVEYINDPAPVVSNFLTVNSTTPNTPPINADMNFVNNAAVYIKWKASDNGSISKVALYTSVDGSNYTLITDTLSNGSSNGASCSYAAPYTGCFVWNSTYPNDSFFKLQLRVTDDVGQTSQLTSPPLNSGSLNLLAGNQDPGHNGNAKQTVFNTLVGTDTAPGTLLVTTDGKIFFNDTSYGIIYIDPKTNNSKVLLRLAKENEDSYGDGIPVEQARAKEILRTTLDYQNRILVYDRYMIRRIDTTVEPMTIETIIGADPSGNLGTSTADTVADPRDVKINLYDASTPIDEWWYIKKRAIFQAHPNGDIYFVSDNPTKGKDNGGRIRIYKGSLAVPRVEAFRFSGVGVKNQPAWDLNTSDYSFFSLRYDPETSVISKAYVQALYHVPGNSYGPMTELDPTTWVANGVHPDHPFANGSMVYYDVQSMDGRVYRANRYTENRLSRLNDDGTWTSVLGTGAAGECVDGTAATSCAVSLDDAFVDRYGRIYFSTRGIIKTVVNGNVYTLFGQRKDAGDGGAASDMRLSLVYFLDHGAGDNIVLIDHQENKMREIVPGAGAEVRLVAGTGRNESVNTGIAANAQSIPYGSWNGANAFATNPANGDVYMSCDLPGTTNIRICKLNRATGFWEVIVPGTGTTLTSSQTAIPIADLLLNGYAPAIFGYQGGNLLMNHHHWNGTAHHSANLRVITPTTAEYIAGAAALDNNGDSCPDGVATNCNIGLHGVYYNASPTYFGSLSGWLFNPFRDLASGNAGDLHVAFGGNVRKMLSLPSKPVSYAYDNGHIYVCLSGKIYDVAITNASDLTSTTNWPLVQNTHYTITQMPMPASNIACEGRRMLVKPASGPKPKRLVMVARQNGLPAIIEYFLP
ncbi:hemagglutinin [Bdellovibrio bacteriovorus]